MFQHATDDQTVLAICFGAFAVCGLVMYFSHHVGQFAQKARSHDLTRLEQLRLQRSHMASAEISSREKAA